MRPSALMIGATLVVGTMAGTASAASAQGYDWGGGPCIGDSCARPVYRDGYRVVRRYETYDVRPGVRIYERRTIRRHHEWDDDDFDDDLD